eukprot:6800079-Prymnesium_polylepis.1
MHSSICDHSTARSFIHPSPRNVPPPPPAARCLAFGSDGFRRAPRLPPRPSRLRPSLLPRRGGWCEDGGGASTTGLPSGSTVCLYGYDCQDCGSRHPLDPPQPPSPRAPWTEPSPPAPPAPPVTPRICLETCMFPSDNLCDDGGPGAEYNACPIESDCTDCGPRLPGAPNPPRSPPPPPQVPWPPGPPPPPFRPPPPLINLQPSCLDYPAAFAAVSGLGSSLFQQTCQGVLATMDMYLGRTYDEICAATIGNVEQILGGSSRAAHFSGGTRWR